jgi:hypothetical protein
MSLPPNPSSALKSSSKRWELHWKSVRRSEIYLCIFISSTPKTDPGSQQWASGWTGGWMDRQHTGFRYIAWFPIQVPGHSIYITYHQQRVLHTWKSKARFQARACLQAAWGCSLLIVETDVAFKHRNWGSHRALVPTHLGREETDPFPAWAFPQHQESKINHLSELKRGSMSVYQCMPCTVPNTEKAERQWMNPGNPYGSQITIILIAL